MKKLSTSKKVISTWKLSTSKCQEVFVPREALCPAHLQNGVYRNKISSLVKENVLKNGSSSNSSSSSRRLKQKIQYKMQHKIQYLRNYMSKLRNTVVSQTVSTNTVSTNTVSDGQFYQNVCQPLMLPKDISHIFHTGDLPQNVSKTTIPSQ